MCPQVGRQGQQPRRPVIADADASGRSRRSGRGWAEEHRCDGSNGAENCHLRVSTSTERESNLMHETREALLVDTQVGKRPFCQGRPPSSFFFPSSDLWSPLRNAFLRLIPLRPGTLWRILGHLPASARRLHCSNRHLSPSSGSFRSLTPHRSSRRFGSARSAAGR